MNSRLIGGAVHWLVEAHFAMGTDTIMYVTCCAPCRFVDEFGKGAFASWTFCPAFDGGCDYNQRDGHEDPPVAAVCVFHE